MTSDDLPDGAPHAKPDDAPEVPEPVETPLSQPEPRKPTPAEQFRAEIENEDESPESLAAAMRYCFAHARHSLGLRIHGHEELVDALALVVTQHIVAPESAQRLVLIGPSGSGKTTAALALSECMKRPCVRINVEDITATGWSGTQLGDCLADIDAQAVTLATRGHGSFEDLRAESIVILDELDKIATSKHEGASWSHQIQKQQSMLGLLAKNGQIVSGSDSRGPVAARTLKTDRMLIIGCGVFDGLPSDRDPTPENVIALGFLPELVERMGSLHRLKPLPPEALIDVFKEGLEPVCEHFHAFGYNLDVTREACIYAGQLVSQGHGGPRSGVTWLTAAADGGLLALLKAEAPAGDCFTLTPDDIRVAVRRSEPPTAGSEDDAGSPPSPVW